MPMNAAKLLLLNVLGGDGSPVTYLFRDEFTTDEAAPLTSPRTAEPGPGTWAVTDTGNVLSVAGDALDCAVNTTMPSLVTTNAFTVAAGLTCVTRWAQVSGYMNVGLNSSTRRWRGVGLANGITPASGQNVPVTNNDYYRTATVVTATGDTLFLINGGVQYPDWVLVWVQFSTLGGSIGCSIASGSNGSRVKVDYMRVYMVTSLAINSILTLNITSPADQTEYTGDADGIIDLTVTAPGSLDGSATTRCGFYYRADADLTPAWHCYVDGTGAFNLDSIDAAGTRTNRITAAGVITGGGTRTLRVICAGTKHHAHSLNGTTWTERGSEVNLSLNDTVTTIEPSIPAGWTAANLRSYPRTSSAYAELDRT